MNKKKLALFLSPFMGIPFAHASDNPQHKVRPGESFSLIASRLSKRFDKLTYKNALELLKKLNKEKYEGKYSKVFPGDLIRLPLRSEVKNFLKGRQKKLSRFPVYSQKDREEKNLEVYRVAPGDTFSGILRKKFPKVPFSKINKAFDVFKEENPYLSSISKLYIGQEIFIPTKNKLRKRLREISAGPALSKQFYVVPKDEVTIYDVIERFYRDQNQPYENVIFALNKANKKNLDKMNFKKGDKIQILPIKKIVEINRNEGPSKLKSKFIVKEEYYLVKKGDTLSELAERFVGEKLKFSLPFLLKFNKSIADPNKIFVGQKISLPPRDELKEFQEKLFKEESYMEKVQKVSKK